jgi:site-specific DNA-methyltransferase (cytosine-N4-specific)
MTFQILHGSALDVLKTLDAESVQTCITSPPYYGLRSYGTDPQVWGNHNGCEHVWRSEIKKGISGGTASPKVQIKGSENFQITPDSQHAFCLNCNAWRGELGLEPTFQLYISHLIEIFAEVKRVLKKDGTCWVNLGDSYAGSWGAMSHGVKAEKTGYNTRPNTSRPQGIREKSLMNIPARFAIAMTDELKMIQRNQLIWYKRACMPSSAKDRFTVDYEPIFFFAKEPRYKFNQQLEPEADMCGRGSRGREKTSGFVRDATTGRGLDAFIDTGTRNKRCVWDVPFEPSGDEHYASYPTKLVEPMILAGTDEGDTVLDIFNGTATTGLVALRNRRNYIGIELNEKYIGISKRRLKDVQVKLF